MSDITPEQVRALKPILERARKDRIAQRPKKDDGTGYAEAKWAFEPLTLASVERHFNGGPALGVGAIKPGESVTFTFNGSSECAAYSAISLVCDTAETATARVVSK